jgi:hypothetical protein
MVLVLLFCTIQKASANRKAPVCYTLSATEAVYFPSASVPQYTLSPCTTYDFVYSLNTTSIGAVSDNITINLPAGISYVSLTPAGSGPSVSNVSGGTSPVFAVSSWDNSAPATFTITVQTPSVCVQGSGITTISGGNSCNTYSGSSSLHIEPPVLHATNTVGAGSLLLNIGDVNELVFSLGNASTNGAGIPNIDITSISADPSVTLYGEYYLSTSSTALTGNFYTYNYPAPVAGSISAHSPITSGSIHIGSTDFTYFFGSTVFPSQPQELYIHIPYRVTACATGGGTYTASWGCGSTSCTSIPITSNINVQTGTPQMAVVGYPAFQNGSYCGPGSSSSVIGFIYKNNGTPIGSPAPAGNARATNLQLDLYCQASFGTLDLNSFQVASGVNTLALSSPVVSSAGTVYIGSELYNAYLVDFSQLSAGVVGWNPLGTGNTLADLDADGKVNDLAEAGTFTITATYNYNTASCPQFNTCGGSFKNLPYIFSRYNNQCYSLPPMPTAPNYSDAAYYYNAQGSGGSISGPADVVEGSPFNVEICTAPYTQRWGPTGFDFDCPNGYHQIKVNLPLGYHLDFSSLTSAGPGLYNLPAVMANGRCGGSQSITPTIQEICGANPLDPSFLVINFGRIPYSNCGPWNETFVLDCFSLPLYLDCSGTAAACATVPLNFGSDNISFSLQYICDQSCATCVSDIECGSSSIYHHCSGSCDSYFSTVTNSFSFKRTTLGWSNPGATSACSTPLTALSETTDPPLDLEAAYPGDVIEAKLQGSFTGTLSSPGPVYNGPSFSTIGLQIRYDDLPTAVRASPFLFDFDQQNGYITITNSVTTASITVPSNTISYVPVVNGAVVEMNFWLPASAQAFMSSSTDTYVFDADLFLVARATPALGSGTTFYAGHASFPLTDLRAEFLGQRPGSPLPAPDVSCDSWGAHFTMIQPSTAIGYYPDASFNPVSTCEVYPVQFIFQCANGKYGIAHDDFPFEFRPYAGLDPQVSIKLPPGYQYISSTFNIMQSAASSAAGSHNGFNASPPLVTGNPYPISDEVVTTTVSGTTIQYNGLSASNPCWPLLDGKYNAWIPYYTITVLMQPTCTAPASDHFEFAGGYTEGIQQSDPAYQVHTSFNVTNLPVHHINPVLTVVPAATSVNVYSNQANFAFTICDGIPANANHPWIAIENSMLNSLDLSTATVLQTAPTSATLTTVPYTDGNGNTGILVNTANIPAGHCLQLLLSATVNSNGCVPTGSSPVLDQLNVSYGNECAGDIITSPGGLCEQGSVVFAFERYPSDLQLFQSSLPSAAVDLCDGTLQYELIVSSSDIGTITNPSFVIDLPAGISVNSISFEYPIGGPSYPVSTPDAYTMSGDPVWNIYAHVPLPGGNGLTGVTTAPANEVKVHVTLQTSCTYNVTDYINFYAEGISSCSEQLTTLPVQHRPSINNALPLDELDVQVSMSTSDNAAGLNCSNTATFTVTVNNTGAQANLHTETLTVTVPGSPLVLSNTGSAVVSGSTLTWTIPPGTIGAGGFQTFTFDLDMGSTISCQTHLPVAAVVGFSEVVNCDESGGECTVGFSSEPDTLFIDACCPCILVLEDDQTICSGQTLSLNATTSGALSYSWAPASGLSCTSCANPTASPTVTTTYTATVTTATGTCSDEITITVNPLPVITVNSPTICYRIQTATLTASGAVTYTWTPSSTLSSPNGATVTATPSVTVIYTVSGTDANGCTGTATSTVTVLPLPLVTVNSPTVCSGQTTVLTASGALTYSWTPPTGLSSTTGSTVTLTPDGTVTTYTVMGTDANGCFSYATSTVTILSAPVVSIGSNSPVCSGSTLNLTASGGGTYSWSGPNSFSSTLQNPSIANVTSAAAGVYTVTVTGTNGCTATATVSVSIKPLPSVTIGSNSPVCSGTTLNLTSTGGGTYSWSGPNSFSSTVQNPSIANVTTAATGIYTVTVTGANGCIASSTVSVTIKPSPTAIIGSNAPVCAGTTLSLLAMGGVSYSWSGPNSFSSTLQSPTIPNVTAAAGGIYTVTVTGSNGCQASTTTSVTILPAPVVTIGSNSPVCEGTTLNLTSTGGGTYSWSGPNSFSSTLQNPAISNVTAAAGGIYTVSVTGANGCSASATTSVTIKPAPAITVSADTDSICKEVSAHLTVSGGSVTYTWTPSGSLSCANCTNPTANPTATTIYTVTGTGANGCQSTATITIYVNTNGGTGWPKHPEIASDGISEITGIVQDASGNTYVVGNYTKTLKIGTFTLTSSLSTITSVFVAKYSDCGVEWAQKLYSSYGDTYKDTYGRAIVLDNNNDVVVTGSYYGTLNLPALPGYPASLSSGSRRLVYVVRMDGSSGGSMDAVQSNAPALTTVEAEGTGLAYKSGYVYVSGHSKNDISFGTLSFVTIPNSDRDIFVAKLDAVAFTTPAGSWIKKFGYPSTTAAQYDGPETEVSVDNSNNVYVGTTIFSNVSFNMTSYGNGSATRKGFVGRYNSSGSETYGFAFSNTTNDIELNDIEVSSGGTPYVTGSWKGNIQGPSSSTITSVANRDIYMAKLNNTGSAFNVAWLKKGSGAGDDDGKGVSIDATATNAYFTGRVTPTANFDGFGAVSGLSTGGDAYVYKVTTSTGTPGYITTSKTNPSSSGNITTGNAVHSDAAGSTVVFGGSYKIPSGGSAIFNVTIGTTSPNNPSFFAARANGSGVLYRVVGVDEPGRDAEDEGAIQLFPNPNNGTFMLKFRDHLLSKARIEVYDMQGRKVLAETNTISDEQVELNLKGIQEGVYMVMVWQDGEVYSKRVVIMK